MPIYTGNTRPGDLSLIRRGINVREGNSLSDYIDARKIYYQQSKTIRQRLLNKFSDFELDLIGGSMSLTLKTIINGADISLLYDAMKYFIINRDKNKLITYLFKQF